MVHQLMIFVFFFVLALTGHAQDERYYRHILAGELPRMNQNSREAALGKFNVYGASYKFDLDNDKLEETIQSQKRDGVDWLEIKNSSGSKIFEVKLLAMGAESVIYKIKVVNISPTIRAIIIFLDEGIIKAKRFESTARFFVLTYESNNLSKISMTEGPHFFQEKEGQREQYSRRDYAVNIYDIDGDGIREIAVQYNHIQRIMKYSGKGEWTRI